MKAMPPSQTEWVDAHCHIDLFDDPPLLVGNVSERRIHTIAVTNAPSVFTFTERLASASRYLHAAVGLHPELVATHGHEISLMWPLIERTRFVGEIGLDYSTRDQAVRARQRAIFSKILEKCATYGDKTITVHSRRAAADTISAIGGGFPGRVILHWFSGSVKELEKAVEYGLYFSVNHAMTRSKRGCDLVRAMPRDRVITESDGPFVRVGGSSADPASVVPVVSFLAELWRVSQDDAAQIVMKNSGLA